MQVSPKIFEFFCFIRHRVRATVVVRIRVRVKFVQPKLGVYSESWTNAFQFRPNPIPNLVAAFFCLINFAYFTKLGAKSMVMHFQQSFCWKQVDLIFRVVNLGGLLDFPTDLAEKGIISSCFATMSKVFSPGNC